MSNKITGAEFRDFYQNHWPKGSWHEDEEYQIEAEDGTFLIADDEVLDLEKMGYVVYPNRGGQDEHRSFSEVWDEWKAQTPEISVLSWRVPAEKLDEVNAFMSSLGVEPVTAREDPTCDGPD